MYRCRANWGILIFGLFCHEDRGLNQPFPSPRKANARMRPFLPMHAHRCFVTMPKEKSGLSYVGHDDGQVGRQSRMLLFCAWEGRTPPIGRAATRR